MRRTLIVTAVALAVVMASAATAEAAQPVVQRFTIVATTTMASHTGRVLASGIVVNGRGTAVATSPTSYALSFPTGPGTLTETVVSSAGGIGPGCVERLTQTGTFTFGYDPIAQPGFHFGGDGTYTQKSFTVYRTLPGGGCSTTAPPVLRRATVDAGATTVFGMG